MFGFLEACASPVSNVKCRILAEYDVAAMMLPSIKYKNQISEDVSLDSDRYDMGNCKNGRCGRGYMEREFGSCGREMDYGALFSVRQSYFLFFYKSSGFYVSVQTREVKYTTNKMKNLQKVRNSLGQEKEQAWLEYYCVLLQAFKQVVYRLGIFKAW